MQPRRSCPSFSSNVTNAPRQSAAPGTSGTSGGERPSSAAAMAARARPSSAARSAGVSSGSSMVLLSAPDRMRAIELLVDDDAGELVRQRQRSQAPGTLGTLHDVGGKPVRSADHERDVAAVHLPPPHQLRELLRG